MKYAQLVTGLLIGTALGGSVVASTGGAGGGSEEDIRQIVRQVILDEPQLILESVQKFQANQQAEKQKASSEALKDEAFKAQLLDATNDAYIGPKNAKHVIVEFFDYNCPACKAMFEQLDKLYQAHDDVKIVFREFPIFGETSDTNSRLGLAVWNLHPDKYLDFHRRMMKTTARDTANTHKIIKDMGLNLDKIKTEAEDKKYYKILETNREMATKLHVQGTPSLIVGDDFIPHGMSFEELESRLYKK